MTQRWAPDRRAILKSLGLTVAADVLPLTVPLQALEQANPDPVSCFVEEGGRRGSFPLVVGALITREPDRHTAAIGALRTTHSYKRRLKFASNDKHKLKFAADVIDYFAAQPDLRYVALVVTDKDKRWPATKEDKNAVYFDIYKRLLDQIRNDGANNLVVRKRNRTASGRDKRLHEHLTGGAAPPNAVLMIRPVLTGKEELTYLSGFLAGCIRADLVGTSTKKSAPIAQLKRALGVGQLTDVSAARVRVTTINL